MTITTSMKTAMGQTSGVISAVPRCAAGAVLCAGSAPRTANQYLIEQPYGVDAAVVTAIPLIASVRAART